MAVGVVAVEGPGNRGSRRSSNSFRAHARGMKRSKSFDRNNASRRFVSHPLVRMCDMQTSVLTEAIELLENPTPVPLYAPVPSSNSLRARASR